MSPLEAVSQSLLAGHQRLVAASEYHQRARACLSEAIGTDDVQEIHELVIRAMALLDGKEPCDG